MTNPALPRWRKSTYSGSQSDCVEVAHDLAQLRDSKNPDGPRLAVTPAGFIAFRDAAKDGRFSTV